MNRRDFLKAAGLALAALVLPKMKPKPEIKNAKVEFLEGTEWVELPGARLETHSLTDYVPYTDEMWADVITEEDIRKFAGHSHYYDSGQTLMGYPIFFNENVYPLPESELKLEYVDWIPEEEITDV